MKKTLKMYTFNFTNHSPIEQMISVYAERLELAKDIVLHKLNKIGIDVKRKDLKLIKNVKELHKICNDSKIEEH